MTSEPLVTAGAGSRLRDRAGEARLVLVLAALAGAVLVSSLVFTFVLPQTPIRLERASAGLVERLGLWSAIVDLGLPVPRDGSSIAAVLVGFALLGCAACGAAAFLAWNRSATRRRVLLAAGASAVFLAASVLALPTAQADIYDYIAFGRVAAVHGENPYETPPSAFPDDPTLPYASPKYRERPDNKLPAWMLFNRALAEIPGESPVANLLVYRSALALLTLANLALVALVLRAVAPRAVLAGIVLFGWNPVVWLYGASKTDTLMVFFFLLGTLVAVRAGAGRRAAAAVPFGISIFVKLISLPLVAVWWLRELALRRWRALALEAGAVALVGVAVYAPWGGFELFRDHVGLFGGGGSAGDTGAPSAATPALSVVPRPLLIAALLLVALWIGLRQDGSSERLLRAFGLVALIFAVLLVDPNSAWYLMTLVAAASLAVDRRLAAAAIVLSFAAVSFTLWQSHSSPEHPLPDLEGAPRIAAFLVPLALLALAAALLYARRRRIQGAPR